MNSQALEGTTTKSLKRRKRFSSIALYIVWIGGLIGVLASFSKLISDGSIEIMTFVVSVIALIASIPVYLERKKILGILKDRAG